MDLEPSSTVCGSSSYVAAEPQPRNPYARTPSRRAIACVTCAKAKTKCNKAVPACSRCITKGIMCEPRSTRRTSENKHRSNTRRHSKLPREHQSRSVFSHYDQSTSPRNSSPSDETKHMRSMSYDCYSTVKTDEQTLVLSGYPVLTPLPTDTLYTTEESQSSSNDYEQNLVGLEQTMSTSNLSSLGGLSPPTPGPMVFHDPAPTVHCMEYGSYPQSWCEEVSASIEYDFGSTLTDVVAAEMWTMPSTTITIPATSHTSWPQPELIFQQPQMQVAHTPHPNAIRTYPDSQSSSDGCFSSPILDWRIFESAGTEISSAASTSLLLNIQSGWEDGLRFEPLSYQRF